jgi:uncharacterized membrane protein YqjE
MGDRGVDDIINEPDSGPGGAEPLSAGSVKRPGLLDHASHLLAGVGHLFGAQLQLFGAELNLARSALVMMLLMGLAAIVFAVALGLTLLALMGWGLAQWLGSWAWALAVLAVVQLLFLLGAILAFKRCLHWLTLPATRAEWKALMKAATRDEKPDGRGNEP